MPELIDEDERARREAALDELMELMRPAVQEDGGDLVVTDVDYDAGIVEVELQGACGSCAISAMTLQGGVERLLKDRLSWVTEVRGASTTRWTSSSRCRSAVGATSREPDPNTEPGRSPPTRP